MPAKTQPARSNRTSKTKVKESTEDWLAKKLAEDKGNKTLDWERAEREDPKDMRCDGPPCNGDHMIAKNGRIKNASMVMYRCTNPGCGIRLLYVPSVGSTGSTRKATPLEHLEKADTTYIMASAAKTPVKTERETEKKMPTKPKMKAKAKAKKEPDDPEESEELQEEAPQWDGKAATWKAFREAMDAWLAGRTPTDRSAAQTPAETEGSADQSGTSVSWSKVFTPTELAAEVNRRRQRSTATSS